MTRGRGSLESDGRDLRAARKSGARSAECAWPAWWSEGPDGRTMDGLPLSEVARCAGTPAYVYSARQIMTNVDRVRRAFSGLPVTVLYAVKANPCAAILALLAELGLGAEIVSGGELFRARRAGFSADRISFSGVGKTDAEIEEALRIGVGTIVLESVEEAYVVEAVARREGRRAAVALRLHPDVVCATHPYLATGEHGTKFGLEAGAVDEALELLAKSNVLELVGLHTHIGSQIVSTEPYLEALGVLLGVEGKARARGLKPRFLDLGGGFAIPYGDADRAFPLDRLAKELEGLWPRHLDLRIEPGRLLVADAGVLLVRVLCTKTCGSREFVVVDAGMNALLRPALYGARHRVCAIRPRPGRARAVDVVGPICENADYLAREQVLPMPERGDLLAVLDAGAYGFSMASQYNSQPRPAEAVVWEGRVALARTRETYASLVEGEPAEGAAGWVGGGSTAQSRAGVGARKGEARE